MRTETKVGIFALITIAIIAYSTIKLGSRSVIAARGYEVTVVLDTAMGLRPKTPVELAGVQIGVVKDIDLVDSQRAKAILLIRGDVQLPADSKALVRTKGFLGEAYVQIIPGTPGLPLIERGQEIPYGGYGGDINVLITQFNDIAADIKSVTSSLKEMVGKDETSPVWRIVNNLDKFTEVLAKNQENFNSMSNDLAELAEALKDTVHKSKENVEESLNRIASITRKVDEGKGTIGKLVNDDETVNKLNEAVDNLNDALGGLKRLEVEVGYHGEYLGRSEDVKNYVNLTLKPRPDKEFIFDFVSDPAPSPDRVRSTSTITAGGASTTVETDTQTTYANRFRISAQLAKKLYDFKLRGGIIESRGGVGLDYEKGPVGLQFSAFDFNRPGSERPHLKLLGNLNLTKNFYLVSGVDDMISRQLSMDWFVGGGLRLVDEDVKSLLSIGSGALRK